MRSTESAARMAGDAGREKAENALSKAELVDPYFGCIRHRRTALPPSKGELIDGLKKLVTTRKNLFVTSSY